MSAPAFWPMAMASALMQEGSALVAKNLQFVDEEIRIHSHPRPDLAKGKFVALGRELHLRNITAPEQVLNAAQPVGTPAHHIQQKTVPGGHMGLFMGSHTLSEHWPPIARSIVAQSNEAPARR